MATKVDDLTIAKKMVKNKQSADSRNIPYSMTFAGTKKLLTTPKCYFTGKKFSDKVVRSFDRLDNTIGYTDENVVACDQKFNSRKSDLSVEEIIMMYEGLKKKGIIK